MVVHGDADELVPTADVDAFAKKLSSQRNIVIKHKEIKGAGHFFQGHMDALIDEVSDYMDAALKKEAALDAG